MATTKKLTGMQAMRLVLYAIAVLAGLAAVIADTLGYGDIAGTINSLSATLLVLTGGTAAFNIEKGKQHVNPVEVLDTIGAVAGAAAAVNQADAARYNSEAAGRHARTDNATMDKYGVITIHDDAPGFITVDELRDRM